MIKNSDIKFSVYKEGKNLYQSDTIVEAQILLTKTCAISHYFSNDISVDHVKLKLRHALLMSIYGDLIDNMEEMYGLAMIKSKPDYGTDARIQAIKRKIDKIMRGETLEDPHDMIVATKHGISSVPPDSSTYRDIARANSSDSMSTRWGSIL